MPVKGNSAPAIERTQGKFTINIITLCWEWVRSRSSQGKYPTVGVQGSHRPEYAYRVAWESVNGPVPDAAVTPCPDGSDRWELHHACFTRACVNPDHIQLLTRREHCAVHNQHRAEIRAAKAA